MKPFKATPKGMTLVEIMAYFSTDEKARAHLESITWPNGPVCPRCKTNDQARISKVGGKTARAGLYCCKDCRRQFTVTVGTIFEDTHIPLHKWVIAWYLLCASKKGISSLQLQRMLDLGSYKSALFLTHRIRYALQAPEFAGKLEGEVEVDETYVGGKVRTGFGRPGRPGAASNKVAVVSLVQRNGGGKRSMVMDRVTAANLRAAVLEHVAPGSFVLTDSFGGYKKIPAPYKRRAVNHGKGEYYRDDGDVKAHTNTVESSFSLLKRGIVGAFHHVSKKHLPLYLAEFDHRFSTRRDSDTERTIAAIKKAPGKRLTYKPLTKKI